MRAAPQPVIVCPAHSARQSSRLALPPLCAGVLLRGSPASIRRTALSPRGIPSTCVAGGGMQENGGCRHVESQIRFMGSQPTQVDCSWKAEKVESIRRNLLIAESAEVLASRSCTAAGERSAAPIRSETIISLFLKSTAGFCDFLDVGSSIVCRHRPIETERMSCTSTFMLAASR